MVVDIPRTVRMVVDIPRIVRMVVDIPRIVWMIAELYSQLCNTTLYNVLLLLASALLCVIYLHLIYMYCKESIKICLYICCIGFNIVSGNPSIKQLCCIPSRATMSLI